MARIRTVKPDFFKNEDLAELPVTARLLFIGLFCLADCEGRLEDRPKRIKAEIFPYDNIETNDLLTRLQSAGFINRYEVGDLKVIQVVNFLKHQRLTGKEAQQTSELPERPENTEGKQLGNNWETPGCFTDAQEGKGKERKGIGKEGSNAREKNVYGSNFNRQPNIPTSDAVSEHFARGGGTVEMAVSFYAKHESTGWFLNGSPITNWVTLADRFITNWKTNEQANTNRTGKSGGRKVSADEARSNFNV